MAATMTITNFYKHITVDEYVKMNDCEGERDALVGAIEARDSGTPCEVCGNSPIWAAASGPVGWNGCFTCITGEADASEDYEVERG